MEDMKKLVILDSQNPASVLKTKNRKRQTWSAKRTRFNILELLFREQERVGQVATKKDFCCTKLSFPAWYCICIQVKLLPNLTIYPSVFLLSRHQNLHFKHVKHLLFLYWKRKTNQKNWSNTERAAQLKWMNQLIMLQFVDYRSNGRIRWWLWWWVSKFRILLIPALWISTLPH